ncbi:TolC family protein [Bdellovibrionota bacterium FG-1]
MNRLRLFSLLGVLGAFVTSGVVAAAAPGAIAPLSGLLTIRAALEQAISHNPSVREARERAQEAESLVGVSLAPSLPQLSAGLNATYRKDPLNAGNAAFGGEAYNVYDVNLKAAQSLYSGGSLLSSLSDAKKEQRIRSFDVEVAERDLSVQVIQAYYSILLSQRRVSTLIETRGVEKEVLGVAKHREAIGRSQYLDVLQIQTLLALLEPKIAQAQNSVKVAAAQLAELLGEQQITEWKLPDQLVSVDGRCLIKNTGAQLPELKRAASLRDQFEDRRDTSFAKYLPKLDLVGTWGRNSYVKTDLLDSYSTYWTLGFQVSVPIFSGLASVFERRQLASQAAQLEIDESKVRSEKSLAQILARQDLELAMKVASASKEAFSLAEKTLTEALRKYRLATIDYQQFLTTQSNYLEAVSALDQSKYDTLLASAKYCAASGIPVSELVTLLEANP